MAGNWNEDFGQRSSDSFEAEYQRIRGEVHQELQTALNAFSRREVRSCDPDDLILSPEDRQFLRDCGVAIR